jgi:hypothetical protein
MILSWPSFSVYRVHVYTNYVHIVVDQASDVYKPLENPPSLVL